MFAAPRIVIVGAGVGSLASAIDLAASGFDVLVLERASGPGGKMTAARVGDALVDAGPTVLTMRWVFEELFAAAGRSLERYVVTERAQVIARHAWSDGAGLDLFADPDRSAAAIADAFGPDQADAFRLFCGKTRAIYDTVKEPFLRSQRDTRTMLQQARSMGVGALARIDALRSMARSLEATFTDPHLRQLFGRYATYCGSSPYEAPATFNLIAHVEQQGVYRVRGGMHALTDALVRLARELGVVFRFDTHVERIVVAGGRAAGVRAGGETIPADAVVFNGDVAALGAGLLGGDAKRGAKPARTEGRSLSAMTWALVADAGGFPLLHHNVFFSADYAREFRSLLGEQRPADEPTVYICAQDRGDGAAGPGSASAAGADGATDRLLIVVNAPATGEDAAAWTAEEAKRWEQATFSTLNRCGLTLTTRVGKMTTPAGYASRFPATGGALYGARARGALSPLARAGARSRIPGLYLAGGSVHPGPGVPMAALSGRLAARRILEDLASTRRSSRAATSGTTSTP